MVKVENGNTVSVHYSGTLDDGTEFDNSRNRGEPITFTVGSGEMIPGFESALPGMEPGEKKTFTISPDNAYGQRNEEAVQTVSASSFPPDFEIVDDATIQGTKPDGQIFLAKVISHTESDVILDFNHPLAGKDLNFSIELMNIV